MPWELGLSQDPEGTQDSNWVKQVGLEDGAVPLQRRSRVLVWVLSVVLVLGYPLPFHLTSAVDEEWAPTDCPVPSIRSLLSQLHH